MKESLSESEERNNFWEEVEIIERTEGFSNLTEDQQRIILLSLYIQDRSERSTAGYLASQRYVDQFTCHESISFLETGFSFDAEYTQVSTKLAAEELIESFGFPCVIHIQRRLPNTGLEKPWHSFLALGYDRGDEIVIWEKEGLGLPFRVSDLRAQFLTYGHDKYWGIRKLNSGST